MTGYSYGRTRFDGPSDAALPLQTDVAASVARAMRSRLAPATARANRQRIDGEAADLYLRGRFYWNQRTEVSLKQAIEYFEQSIARAPSYAPAYAALADCYAAMVYSCYMAPASGIRARAGRAGARQPARSPSAGGPRVGRLSEHVFRLGSEQGRSQSRGGDRGKSELRDGVRLAGSALHGIEAIRSGRKRLRARTTPRSGFFAHPDRSGFPPSL